MTTHQISSQLNRYSAKHITIEALLSTAQHDQLMKGGGSHTAKRDTIE
jgi:hypothetical protein